MINLKIILCIMIIVLFAFSIGLNVFFLAGKGIQVNNTYNQQQYQNQQQSQILISLFAKQGKIKWFFVSNADIAKKNLNSQIDFLNTLSPEQSLFAKLCADGVFYFIIEEEE